PGHQSAPVGRGQGLTYSASSSSLMPPSPPAEKATARQDQAGKSCKPRLWSPAGWSADRRGPRRFRNGRRVGSRRPEKESPAEAGQGRSWNENQDEAYQHQQRIAAVLRLVAQQPLPGVGPAPESGRRDWFRVRNVTAIEFQKLRRCGESGGPLPSESSRVTPRDTRNPA